MLTTQLIAQTETDGGGGLLLVLIELAVLVVVIVGGWKVFTKAGQPGWASIVPFFNIYTLLKIVGRPWWWLILLILPLFSAIPFLGILLGLVGLVVGVIVSIDLAKSFGKSALFGIGLVFLAPIFYCILGFGQAKYVGPAARAA